MHILPLSIMVSKLLVFFRYDLGTGLAVIESGHRLVPGQWARIQARRWHRDGVLRVTAIEAVGGGGGALSTDEVNGQSGGDLRSLDVDREPSFVGGLPKTGKTKNITRIAANLGMQQVKGRGHFCKFQNQLCPCRFMS